MKYFAAAFGIAALTLLVWWGTSLVRSAEVGPLLGDAPDSVEPFTELELPARISTRDRIQPTPDVAEEVAPMNPDALAAVTRDVSGTVQLVGAGALADVEVALHLGEKLKPGRSARSDSDGAFQFLDVPEGRHRLEFVTSSLPVGVVPPRDQGRCGYGGNVLGVCVDVDEAPGVYEADL